MRIFDLRADVDAAAGLGTAVTEHLQRIGAHSGLTVQVTLDETSRRLPASVEFELLRILQEAVTNVRRHAGARTLSVHLDVDPPRARMTITDDGRGLQPARVDSMGLMGMRERAARIGAELRVENVPEGGTRVEVRLDPPQGPRTHVADAPPERPERQERTRG